MKYDKINSYFTSEQGLEQLITDYKDLFDQIDDYGQQLLQGMITALEEYSTLLNFATGVYTSLEPLYSLAEAHKLNIELGYYVAKKRELEAKGEKYTAASLDKEASLSVEKERRIRNIIEGYLLASEKIIITCQTQMKRITENRQYKPQEEV